MVTDAYPPMRTSCAVQMYDLAQAFVQEGHQVTVITPDSALKEDIQITQQDGARLVRAKAFKTKDINYVFRTLAEFINPFVIWHKLKKSPEFLNNQYDGIIWYSPTIFWGPLIKKLKQQYKIKAYLILRDIFPDWALDLGLIKKGVIYKFLKAVELFQYKQADVIGVQSPNNLKYFKRMNTTLKANIEVLWNWLGKIEETPCSIDLNKTSLAGRKVFIYSGNMGIAQGIENIIELVKAFKDRKNIGFVFIGRGSEVERLKLLVNSNSLKNTLIFDEVEPSEMLGLLRQCVGGLVALHPNHRTHNIPGKVIMYLRAKLPIIGVVNEGNDLIQLAEDYKLGFLTSKLNNSYLCDSLIRITKKCPEDNLNFINGLMAVEKIFSSGVAIKIIQKSFTD